MFFNTIIKNKLRILETNFIIAIQPPEMNGGLHLQKTKVLKVYKMIINLIITFIKEKTDDLYIIQWKHIYWLILQKYGIIDKVNIIIWNERESKWEYY